MLAGGPSQHEDIPILLPNDLGSTRTSNLQLSVVVSMTVTGHSKLELAMHNLLYTMQTWSTRSLAGHVLSCLACTCVILLHPQHRCAGEVLHRVQPAWKPPDRADILPPPSASLVAHDRRRDLHFQVSPSLAGNRDHDMACGPGSPELSKSNLDMASKLFTFKVRCSTRLHACECRHEFSSHVLRNSALCVYCLASLGAAGSSTAAVKLPSLRCGLCCCNRPEGSFIHQMQNAS